MFSVFRSGPGLPLVALVSAMSLPTIALSQSPVYQWDFNITNPKTNSSIGSGGTATLIGGVTGSFSGGPNGGSGTIAVYSSDPGSGGSDTNFVWQTTGYPAQTGASGTSGARFAGINTTGMSNLLFSFDLSPVNVGSPSSFASKWYQVRYSADGTTFTNLGGPLEYRRTGSADASLFAQETVLSLAGIAPASNMRFEIVAVHAPGSSQYAPAQGTTYSGSAPVFLDLVTVYQGNTWSSTAGSGDLQAGENWSTAAPGPGELSSHLMFGGNENAAVTVTNTNADPNNPFRVLSLSFTTAANSTAYTVTGDQIRLGKSTPTAGASVMAGATTITNASNQQQTISTNLTLNTSQVWDSGPTANGGSLLVNGNSVVFGSGANLTVTGQNLTQISAKLQFLTSSNSITKTGGGTLAISSDNTGLIGANGQFIVNGGSLAVTNTTGSATGAAAIQVNAGGRLTGHGIVAPTGGNTVTVAGGGAIRPGTSAADRTLTIAAGGLTIAAGGIYEVNVFGSGINDTGLLNVTGGVSTPATGPGIAVNLNLVGVDRDTLRAAVGLGNTRVYTLTNVSAASNWNVTANNFTDLGFSATEWVPGQSGNNLILTFKPVPDARFALAVAGAGLLALAAVRRRTRLAARTVSDA